MYNVSDEYRINYWVQELLGRLGRLMVKWKSILNQPELEQRILKFRS